MKKQVLIAALLGLIAALFVGLYLVSVETTYKKSAQKVKVLVSKQYIGQGTLIDETMADEAFVPKEYLQPKALSSMKDIRTSDGRAVFMAVAPIEQGEQILTTKLSMLGADTGIAAIIPSEHRALTIPVDGNLINGVIKPGNRVDVIGIFEFQEKAGEPQEIAITLLQDILVLSAGNQVLGSVSTVKQQAKKDLMPMDMGSSESSVPVSFSVTPQEAEILSLATSKAAIKLVLRPTGEETITESKGTKMSDISKGIVTGIPITRSTVNPDEMRKKQKEIMSILKKYR